MYKRFHTDKLSPLCICVSLTRYTNPHHTCGIRRALCRQYINIKLQSEMYITHLCKFSVYDMVPTLI